MTNSSGLDLGESPEPGPKCRICGKAREAHYNTVHEFTSTRSSLKVSKSSSDTPKSGEPVSQINPYAALRGDPVLRVVLIRKGIIDLEDIAQAEAELKSGVVYGEVHSPRAGGTNPGVGTKSSSDGSLRGNSPEGEYLPSQGTQERLF